MKVGNRIRVFEIINNQRYRSSKKIIGLQRAEIFCKKNDYKSEWSEIITSDFPSFGFNASFEMKNIKHVCTMVIKSIKNEKH